MSTRNVFSLTAAAVLLASPLAFASPDGWSVTSNEAGSEFSGTRGGLTREQVKRELEAARRDGSLRLTQRNYSYRATGPTERSGFVSSPAQRSQAQLAAEAPAPSAWRDLGGEAGWVYQGP